MLVWVGRLLALLQCDCVTGFFCKSCSCGHDVIPWSRSVCVYVVVVVYTARTSMALAGT